MAGGNTDILIFVEDPGAANCVVDLPAALAKRRLKAAIVAAGHAAPYIAGLGGRFETVGGDDDAAAVLDAYRPRLLLAGTSENPDTLGLRLIAEAKRRGVVSVGVVDGPASAEHRFRGRGDGPLAFAPERLLVPDALTRRRYAALGFAAERIADCGHPHYDRVRAAGRELAKQGRDAVRARALPGAPAGQPVVVFLAEVSHGLVAEAFRRGDDYTLLGRGGSDERTRVVLEEVLDALAPARPRPYVVLRLHPKNRPDEFVAYRREIDFVSHGGAALDVAFAADVVIGMTTILLFEAAIVGTPTLSVVPRAVEAEWLTGIGLGVVPCVHDRARLRALLPDAVAEPKRLAGTPAEKVIQFGALERMADHLAGLLAGGARS